MELNFDTILEKTLDTSSTNGNAFLNPVLLSALITDQVKRKPLLRNLLPREDFAGKTYLFDRWASKGLAASVADGGNISLSESVTTQGQVNLSYWYFIAKITNPAQVAASKLVDLYKSRLGHAVQMVMNAEGDAIFNGDANNSSNAGLYTPLAASTTAIDAAGAALSPMMLDAMEIGLRSNGYNENLLFVCSPKVATAIRAFAFAHFRQSNQSQAARFGADFSDISWNGITVVPDVFAGQIKAVAGGAVGTGDGSKTAFAFPNKFVMVNAGNNQGLATYAAPVVKIAGVAKVAGTDYTLAQAADGSGTVTINFAVAPSNAAAVTADYAYEQQNVYLISATPEQIVMPVSQAITVDDKVLSPVTEDTIPLRVKTYSALALRNDQAHVLLKNVIPPTSVVGY